MLPRKDIKSMESFYRTHAYLVEHINAPVRRDLMDEIEEFKYICELVKKEYEKE